MQRSAKRCCQTLNQHPNEAPSDVNLLPDERLVILASFFLANQAQLVIPGTSAATIHMKYIRHRLSWLSEAIAHYVAQCTG